MNNMQQYADLWSSLSEKSRFTEMEMDASTRKRTGSYYTDLKLTDIMMKELVEQLESKGTKKICEYRFLEPCAGVGNFVLSYIKAAKTSGVDTEDAKKMLDNIYVADINAKALLEYRKSLKRTVALFWNIDLPDEYFDKHIGSGLLVDVTAAKPDYIKIGNVFPQEVVRDGFDIVVTNPPYKNLKAEKSHYSSNSEYESDREKYSAISRIAKCFKYSKDGTLNLYKLFVEEIIDRYTNAGAFISLLISASIMSDKTCARLRTHMLSDTKMISIKIIGEESNYIDAQQALSAILLEKGAKTDTVTVVKDYCNNPGDIAEVSIKDILNENTGNAIAAVSAKEYEVLKKLRCFPIIKELPYIINLRGELDLTENKGAIVNNNTGYPLLRGRNIGYYGLFSAKEKEFVLPEFVAATKKNRYIGQNRIICQQIANRNKERRITFALAPANYVLGNSCNFISVGENPYGIDIYAILGLLNTKIINWLFKLTSSNNHVNNYEIDCFPIPVEAQELKEISMLVQKYLREKDEKIIEEIELLAQKAYDIIGLTGEDG